MHRLDRAQSKKRRERGGVIKESPLDQKKKTIFCKKILKKQNKKAFPEYEDFLSKLRTLVQPILDGAPPELALKDWKRIRKLSRLMYQEREHLASFYEVFFPSRFTFFTFYLFLFSLDFVSWL